MRLQTPIGQLSFLQTNESVFLNWERFPEFWHLCRPIWLFPQIWVIIKLEKQDNSPSLSAPEKWKGCIKNILKWYWHLWEGFRSHSRGVSKLSPVKLNKYHYQFIHILSSSAKLSTNSEMAMLSIENSLIGTRRPIQPWMTPKVLNSVGFAHNLLYHHHHHHHQPSWL